MQDGGLMKVKNNKHNHSNNLSLNHSNNYEKKSICKMIGRRIAESGHWYVNLIIIIFIW